MKMTTAQIFENMAKTREALDGCETKAVRDLVVGDRLAFVPTGHHDRVARHLFRCEGDVVAVEGREVVIAWEACEDCGPAREHRWRRGSAPAWIVPSAE